MKLKHILIAVFIFAGYTAEAQVVPVGARNKKTAPVRAVKKNTAPSSMNINGVQMVYVQGGSFTMGNNNGSNDEKPAHGVTLSSFYLAKYELTVGEFRKFINATGYQTTAETQGWSELWTGKDWDKRNGVTWQDDANGNRRPPGEDNHPVTHISFDDADNYCAWLSAQTGKLYRLPTEAEWEYAARGGNKPKSYNNTTAYNMDAIAWYEKNSGGSTHPVGQKQPNELGIYDMMGNVSEWCSDWSDDGYYKNSPSDNPQGPADGTKRVRRGGIWNSDNKKFTLRMDSGVNAGNINGLRLALSINK